MAGQSHFKRDQTPLTPFFPQKMEKLIHKNINTENYSGEENIHARSKMNFQND